MSVVMNQQVMRLAGVLQLQERARTAPPEELPFVIVNETMQVAGYEQAALWDARDRSDSGAEAEANLQVQKVLPQLEEVMLG